MKSSLALGWDELSSALLQSRPVWPGLLSRDLELPLAADGRGPASSVLETGMPGRATPTWFGSACVGGVTAVCCLVSREEFRFGEAVWALTGHMLDV
jgi:hypothetical protein